MDRRPLVLRRCSFFLVFPRNWFVVEARLGVDKQEDTKESGNGAGGGAADVKGSTDWLVAAPPVVGSSASPHPSRAVASSDDEPVVSSDDEPVVRDSARGFHSKNAKKSTPPEESATLRKTESNGKKQTNGTKGAHHNEFDPQKQAHHARQLSNDNVSTNAEAGQKKSVRELRKLKPRLVGGNSKAASEWLEAHHVGDPPQPTAAAVNENINNSSASSSSKTGDNVDKQKQYYYGWTHSAPQENNFAFWKAHDPDLEQSILEAGAIVCDEHPFKNLITLKSSEIKNAGTGAFAKRDIKAGCFLGAYRGNYMPYGGAFETDGTKVQKFTGEYAWGLDGYPNGHSPQQEFTGYDADRREAARQRRKAAKRLHDLDFLEKDDERLLEKRRVFENELKEAEEAESLAIRAVEKVADTLEEHQFAYIDGAEFPKDNPLRYVNGAKLKKKDNPLRYVNGARSRAEKTQLNTHVLETSHNVYYVATGTRDIPAGEELLIDYGPLYWDDDRYANLRKKEKAEKKRRKKERRSSSSSSSRRRRSSSSMSSSSSSRSRLQESSSTEPSSTESSSESVAERFDREEFMELERRRARLPRIMVGSDSEWYWDPPLLQ